MGLENYWKINLIPLMTSFDEVRNVVLQRFLKTFLRILFNDEINIVIF